MNKARVRTGLVFFALAGLSTPAHAYLDPGTGSLLIQGLIATLAAAGVTMRLYWHRLTGFFKGSNESGDEDSDSGDTESGESTKP